MLERLTLQGRKKITNPQVALSDQNSRNHFEFKEEVKGIRGRTSSEKKD
jgi:hypothetical protein